jgi:hypothetical protein
MSERYPWGMAWTDKYRYPAQPVDPCELSDLEPEQSDQPAPWWQRAVWAIEDGFFSLAESRGALGLLLVAALIVAASLGFVWAMVNAL